MIKKILSNKSKLLHLMLFPLICCYYEIVFHLSTVGNLWRLSLVPLLLFSISWGLILSSVTALVTRPKAHVITTAVLIGVSALPYLIEYFVYRVFKIFYDLNTVTGGAGHLADGFVGDTLRTVFSLDGLAKIILFFLPLALYLVFGRKYKEEKPGAGFLCGALALSLMVYGTSMLVVFHNPVLNAPYRTEYNFQSAVDNFGLFTGVRLDLQRLIFGNDADSFEQVDAPASSSQESSQAQSAAESQPEEEPPVVKEYGYNQVELNFKETSSEKLNDLNSYVKSQQASKKNEYTGLFKGKNLIMISGEAFSAEAVDKDLTPTLYRLTQKGIHFKDFYQPASSGTTGGEYQNLFGMMPTSGGKSFKKTADNLNYYTMGSQLDRLGYYGMAYHNNSYTYYDRHKTHNNLGYSGGFMGYGNGMEKYVRNTWPQSDLEMVQGTLPTYIDKEHFNIYYMSVSGHCGYSRSGNFIVGKNWDKVKDLDCSDTVKGYYAANLELEYAVAHLVEELEKKGIADDTVICITNDHFPYGLDENGKLGDMPYLSELYGYQVNDIFQRDHSTLIMWSGFLEKQAPIEVEGPSFTLDILPTLSNLFGVEFDSRLLPGRDVFSDAPALVYNMNYDWKTEEGTYFASTGEFRPAEGKEKPSQEYIDKMKTIVRNKIRYCGWALDNDYFRYLFG